jgi:hypothetical protein
MAGKDKRRAAGGNRARGGRASVPGPAAAVQAASLPGLDRGRAGRLRRVLMPEVTEAARLEIQTVSSSDHAPVHPIYRPSR